jgi:sulfur-oxidizing protein SoxX
MVSALAVPGYWPSLARGVVPGFEHGAAFIGREFSTVLDVGANKGQFAMFARHRWPRARLVCRKALPGCAQDHAGIALADRTRGLCLLCHSGPFPEERQQGNLAPDLAGAGSRWSTAQLRARIVDSRRVNPQSIMPAYHRTEGLERVAPAFRDRPILDAQQVEDVVAYLTTLRNEPGETKR